MTMDPLVTVAAVAVTLIPEMVELTPAMTRDAVVKVELAAPEIWPPARTKALVLKAH